MEIKIGLLLCDHVPEGLIPGFEDYPLMYEQAFNGLGLEIHWTIFDVSNGEFPLNVREMDAYLVSGSRFSVNDPMEWIVALIGLLKESRRNRIPVVGICFGHQLIAKSLGGEVAISPSGWGVGCKKFRFSDESCWTSGDKKELIVPVFHQEQIVRLPAGSNRIASADYCDNFIVGFDEFQLGIQGHPEFQKEYVAALLNERFATMSKSVLSDAWRSLNLLTDSIFIKRRILDFLKMRNR